MGKIRGNHALLTTVSYTSSLLFLLLSVFVVGHRWIESAYLPQISSPIPLAFHLFLTAALLFETTRIRTTGLLKEAGAISLPHEVLVRSLLSGLGFINLLLIGEAVISLDFSHAWLALLLYPTLIGAWELTEGKSEEQELDHETYDEETTEEEDNNHIPPTNPAGTVLGWAIAGVSLSITLIISILVLMLGIFHWTILRLALIQDQMIEASRYLRIFDNDLIITYGVFIPILLIGLFIIFGLIQAGIEFSKRGGASDFERELLDHELEFIDNKLEETAAYAEQQSYPKYYGLTLMVVPALYIAWIIASGVGIFMLDHAINTYLETIRKPDTGWYLYIDDFGFSGLILIFFNIVFIGSIFNLVALISPRYAEYYVYHSGEGLPSVEEVLHERIRNKSLNTTDELSPRDVLLSTYRYYEMPWHIGSILLFTLYVLFAKLDYSSYEMLTHKNITYTEYWTSEVHQLPFSAIDRVRITCYVDSDDDLDINYSIYYGNERRIIVPVQKNLKKKLDDYEILDEKLREQGVSFEFPVTGRKNHKRPAITNKCLSRISENYSPELSRRIFNLLHVDEARAK